MQIWKNIEESLVNIGLLSKKENIMEIVDVTKYDTERLVAIAADIIIELKKRGLLPEIIKEEIEL